MDYHHSDNAYSISPWHLFTPRLFKKRTQRDNEYHLKAGEWLVASLLHFSLYMLWVSWMT